ncbi:MAG TPA: aminotransferase class V-fold PLP-dependent enzyme [Rhodothermales bacterium]|nr:aminotransferase class V-fold PLP-dependent enzyme [Rhodothermales bacterium]
MNNRKIPNHPDTQASQFIVERLNFFDMNLPKLRSLFPHTAHTIYLNHAATSPLSTRVTDALHKWMTERQETRIDNYVPFMDTILDVRRQLAGMLSAPLEAVDVCPNVSTALNWVAQGIVWKPGDRIALPACEFPANVWPFLHLRERGVEIDFIPHTDGVFTLQDVEAALTPRTRLLSVSWVQFLSGFRAPLAEIGKRTRERGVWFLVDAIQGFGALDFGDVEAQGVDFAAGSAHKWIMADQGIGWCYMSHRLMEALHPPMAGWLSGVVDWDNFFDYRFNWHTDLTRYRLGTMNNAGIATMKAALSVYLECGRQWCNQHVLNNAAYLAMHLEKIGLQRYGSPDPAHASGIVTFRHPDPEIVYEQLQKKHIEISVRNRLLRFAPTYYNTLEELDHTIDVIKNL